MAQVYVKVTNRNDFPIKDSYDGIEYVMMPSPAKPTTLPLHVACHFFGISSPDDIHDTAKINYYIKKRWGWNRPEIGAERSDQLCKNMELTISIFEMREVESSDDYLPASRMDTSHEDEHEEEDSEGLKETPKRGRPPGKKDAA